MAEHPSIVAAQGTAAQTKTNIVMDLAAVPIAFVPMEFADDETNPHKEGILT